MICDGLKQDLSTIENVCQLHRTMWYCSSFTVERVCNIILCSTAIILSDPACMWTSHIECIICVYR